MDAASGAPYGSALISALEKLLRREEDSTAELRFKGLVVTIFVLSTTIRITWGLLIRLYGLHPAAGVAAESWRYMKR